MTQIFCGFSIPFFSVSCVQGQQTRFSTRTQTIQISSQMQRKRLRGMCESPHLLDDKEEKEKQEQHKRSQKGQSKDEKTPGDFFSSFDIVDEAKNSKKQTQRGEIMDIIETPLFSLENITRGMDVICAMDHEGNIHLIHS